MNRKYLLVSRYFILAVSGRVLFSGTALSRAPVVPLQEVFELAPGRDGFAVESGDCSSSNDSGSGFCGGHRGARAAAEGEEPVSKKPRSEKGISKNNLEMRIEKFFKKFPCCPISDLCKTQQYLAEGDLRYIRGSNQKYQVVMDVLANEMTPYSLRQFTEMYRRPGCFPLFAMPKGKNEHEVVTGYVDGIPIKELKPFYLEDEEALDSLSQLLDYQTENQTKKFLETLVDIVDKRVPKLNCIFVYGPPSSGKNWFFDMVVNFFLLKGQMLNINKNSGSFAYMDCVDRRIIMWNEPNICESPSTMDTLKMLFGGDDCPAQVKFSGNQSIRRTPVIVLTNDSFLFRNVPAFKDRMVRYDWKAAPFLKTVRSYPNPKVLPALLEKYNVLY